MNHRYAVRTVATRQSSGRICNHHGLAVVVAASAAEAEGMAWDMVRGSYPPQEGWSNYDIQALPIEDPWSPEEPS